MWPYDQNNQQMYQQYANAWDQGDYSQLPEHEVRQNYGQFIQNAPPPMVEQAHQQYYEQIATPFEWKFTKNDLNALLERIAAHERAALTPAA